jgi:hypothetical protein
MGFKTQGGNRKTNGHAFQWSSNRPGDRSCRPYGCKRMALVFCGASRAYEECSSGLAFKSPAWCRSKSDVAWGTTDPLPVQSEHSSILARSPRRNCRVGHVRSVNRALHRRRDVLKQTLPSSLEIIAFRPAPGLCGFSRASRHFPQTIAALLSLFTGGPARLRGGANPGPRFRTHDPPARPLALWRGSLFGIRRVLFLRGPAFPLCRRDPLAGLRAKHTPAGPSRLSTSRVSQKSASLSQSGNLSVKFLQDIPSVHDDSPAFRVMHFAARRKVGDMIILTILLSAHW